MPKIRKHVERICKNCLGYSIEVGGKVSGPYCKIRKSFFPDPFTWAHNPFKKKTGGADLRKVD